MQRLKKNLKLGLVVATAGALALAGCVESRSPGQPQREPEARGAKSEPQPIAKSAPLPKGTYEIQSVAYDDATGTYRMFLLNTPAGVPPMYQTNDVRMARLDDAAIAAGKKSHLEVGDEAPTLFLTQDFQISYTHNVTEERVDPASGEREVVVVRQESSMWSPFMSAMAGAAIGNMLFSPRYYYPPPYAGGNMVGYGGQGTTRTMASQQYAQKFGSEPQASRLSKTGVAPRRVDQDSMRSTGRGAGASKWGKGTGSAPRAPKKSFGFGRRRR